eukprot:99097-Chlamydomonas_euryale.AAC.2
MTERCLRYPRYTEQCAASCAPSSLHPVQRGAQNAACTPRACGQLAFLTHLVETTLPGGTPRGGTAASVGGTALSRGTTFLEGRCPLQGRLPFSRDGACRGASL